MHADAPRKNGGVGFAIAEPRARVRISPARRLQVFDDRAHPMSQSEIIQLSKTIEGLLISLRLPIVPEIHISGAMRTHVGMGSGTAIRLGAIEGTALLNGLQLPQSNLIATSGRGGTSGVGINTYFAGGLVLDLGIPMDLAGYAPSSSVKASRRPAALPSVPMPLWPMLLCVPRSIVPKTQLQEVEFFKRTAPLSPSASFEAAYLGLFNLYASAVENDYPRFCRGVMAMQATAWKQAEWSEYGRSLQFLRHQLVDHGLDCLGMSSLGPMLFCFGSPGVLADINRNRDVLDCEIFQTIPSNLGRSWV